MPLGKGGRGHVVLEGPTDSLPASTLIVRDINATYLPVRDESRCSNTTSS